MQDIHHEKPMHLRREYNNNKTSKILSRKILNIQKTSKKRNAHTTRIDLEKL